MTLVQGRLFWTLCLSTAAHVGVGWLVAEQLPSFAAPAQRALSVAMTPAAATTVLNSIAPSATAAVSPALVQAEAPASVSSIEEPDDIVMPVGVEAVIEGAVERVKSEGPEEVLVARERARPAVRPLLVASAPSRPFPASHSALNSSPVAKLARTTVPVGKATYREGNSRPAPAESGHRSSSAAPRSSAKVAALSASATPAEVTVAGNPGAGDATHAALRVAGDPGAERQAAPVAGNNPPQYPWTARAQGHQGRVVLRVWVSAEGDPSKLAVWSSSGYPTLDRAALRAVEKWHFRPAQRAGRDIESLVHVPVVFRLADDG